ncbi:hypothetical protein [Ramlibacter sp. PS4R-6]|uniref:hypothetical protein n=1 Tax=Ramlibacter sp. PS4R-6 TaxID=3133438 RepID=UPI00309BAE46
MKNWLALPAFFAAQAWAHSGHGMPGEVHWHASDVAGLAVIAVGALLALWLARGE